MARKAQRPQPKKIRPDDIDPHHRWDRPLQAPAGKHELRLTRRPHR